MELICFYGSEIPPELIEIIIYFCHDDSRTLAATSLVCKAWIPCSRYHLFRLMRIRRENVDTFCSLIQSSLSTLHKHLCTLILKVQRSGYSWVKNKLLPALNSPGCTESIRFQNLQLESNCFTPVPREVLLGLSQTPAFRCIRELGLEFYCCPESVDDMMDFACSFDGLDQLGLNVDSWFSSLDDGSATVALEYGHLPHFPRVATLYLPAEGTRPFLAWLDNHSSLFHESLKELTVTNLGVPCEADEGVEIGQPEVARRFLYLPFHAANLPFTLDFTETFDLSNLTKLETVGFFTAGFFVRTIYNALLTIRSTLVRQVCLLIIITDDKILTCESSDPAWATLDRLLACDSRLDLLEMFELEYKAAPVDREAIEGFYGQRFPMCVKKGILAFKYSRVDMETSDFA